MQLMLKPRPRPQKGTSLTEVLVALLILSTGLVGLVALQVRTLRASVDNVRRHQAVMQGQNLLDLMRVDRAAALAGDYNTGKTPVCTSATLAGTTLAQENLRNLLTSTKSLIGRPSDSSTCISAICNTVDLCEVTIRWNYDPSSPASAQSQAITARL